MDKQMCIVKNRSSSTVVYRIPEDNIRREFAPSEQRRIPYEELVHLSFQPGGRELMENFLQIENEQAISDLNIHTEPEYYMSEKQIVELIKTGSLDAFLDCLDYAPMGVIDLLKDYSVRVPLQDYAKRKALKDKTGFDVDKAIENLEAEAAASKPVEETKEEPVAQPTGGRRTRTSYKKESGEAPAKKTISKSK